jgi:hypothetical protein
MSSRHQGLYTDDKVKQFFDDDDDDDDDVMCYDKLVATFRKTVPPLH